MRAWADYESPQPFTKQLPVTISLPRLDFPEHKPCSVTFGSMSARHNEKIAGETVAQDIVGFPLEQCRGKMLNVQRNVGREHASAC